MARHSLTRDQLEDALSDAVSEISALRSELRALKVGLAYYENCPGTGTLAGSIL